MTLVSLDRAQRQWFGAAFERLDADASGIFGVPVTLESAGVQDRPFSRLLRLRVLQSGSAVPLTHVFLKVFKPKLVDGREDGMHRRLVHDFTTTKRVHEAMQRWPGYGAVKPLACYPDLLATVTEQADGRTLLDCLQEEAAWFPGESRRNRLRDTLQRAGRWLSIFQFVEGREGKVSLDDLKDYTDVRLTRMARHGSSGFAETDRQRVLRHIDALAALVAPEELMAVAVHSDMSLGNVLVADGSVTVLDFAMMKRGASLHDLTHLYLQLELLSVKPHFRPRIITQLQDALLHGFDPSLTRERPLFRLLLLLHRVNHLAGVSINRAALPEAVYNRLVRRRHRERLEAELAAGVPLTSP